MQKIYRFMYLVCCFCCCLLQKNICVQKEIVSGFAKQQSNVCSQARGRKLVRRRPEELQGAPKWGALYGERGSSGC